MKTLNFPYYWFWLPIQTVGKAVLVLFSTSSYLDMASRMCGGRAARPTFGGEAVEASEMRIFEKTVKRSEAS